MNGTQLASATVSGTMMTNSVGLYIGAIGDGSYAFNGQIDEFRISKGIARWTSNFTPVNGPYGVGPTLTPTPSSTPTYTPTATPTNWSGIDGNTNSLLHMDGADASTTFVDDTGKAWTAAGNAQIDTAQSKFGGASGLFDGAGDWIDTPDSEDLNVGSGDFTVDFWFRKNANATVQAAYGQANSAATASLMSILLYTDQGGNYPYGAVYVGSSAYAITSSSAITDTNWHHYAFVRNGNTITLYIDGTSKERLRSLA